MFRKLGVRKLGAGKYEINFTKSIYTGEEERGIFARLISSFENVLSKYCCASLINTRENIRICTFFLRKHEI